MRLGERLRLFLSPSASAETLAYLRIVVFISLILESFRANPVRFAALPPELFTAPTGWGLVLTHVPGSPSIVAALWGLFIAASLAAALGWRTHVTAKIAALSAVYVLGIPHLFDLPNHQITHHHHLVWFALVLSFSRCADAWAVDDPRPNVTADTYAAPLAVVWMLVGLIYFFPGIWKITGDGFAWASGEKLRIILEHRWFHLGGYSPPVRIDRWPTLLKVASLATMAFEALFVFCVFTRRARLAAGCCAAGFHTMTAVFMNLTFWPLMVCLPVFCNWSAWRRKPGAPGQMVDVRVLRNAFSMRGGLGIVSALLIALAAICGAMKIDSWPFACYPTFNRFRDPLIDSLDVEFLEGARRIPVDLAPAQRRLGRSRWHRLVELAATQEKDRRRRLLGIARLIALHDPRTRRAESVVFYRVRGSYDPGRGFNEIGREPLLRLSAEEAFPESGIRVP